MNETRWRFEKHPRLLRFALIALVVIFAGGIRLAMALSLSEEDDEDEYLIAATRFHAAYEEGSLRAVTQVDENREHPPLVKMLYALAIEDDELDEMPTERVRSTAPELPDDSLLNARLQSVAFGTLAVLVVSLISLPAGLILALHSIHVHYTSVAYLDALAVLFSTLAVVFYSRTIQPRQEIHTDEREGGSRLRLWILSGLCLGIAVAAKYPYAFVGVIMAAHALYSRVPLRKLLLWGIASLLIFFVLNPYIWPDPVSRVQDQLFFHQDYAVENGDRHHILGPVRNLSDAWKHLNQVMDSRWMVIFQALDLILLALVIIGAMNTLREPSILVWWFFGMMAFLMVWPTQWPQHTMLVIVPYSFVAATGLEWLAHRINDRLQGARMATTKLDTNIGDTSTASY
ncbi:MAG: phospholipid carrier-dependent glycosyltransferase [Chloroflexi bacterium]|nr:phospholipid carrier-dependent glycosyltransferase [Chloroflexota bacterium]